MKMIILHHSLTKDQEVKDFDAIKRYHIGKGWGDIGYQYVIELVNGKPLTFKGRAETQIGAHTLGHNKGTIGICIVGNFDIATPNEILLNELYKLLDDIKLRYGQIEIKGHNEYSTKSCPGKLFPLQSIKDKYARPWYQDDCDYYDEHIGVLHETDMDKPMTYATYKVARVREYKKERGIND